jgi:hypothetical protein
MLMRLSDPIHDSQFTTLVAPYSLLFALCSLLFAPSFVEIQKTRRL